MANPAPLGSESTPASALPPRLGATIRFFNTRGDLVYLNVRSIFRSKYLQTLWFVVVAWQCWSSIHEPRFAAHGWLYKSVFCTFIFCFWYALLFTITTVVTTGLILVRKYRGVLGEHTLTLRDDGVLESTAFNESLHRWAGYHKTSSNRRYLILYTSDVTGFVISRRRPLIEGDLSAFEAILREHTTRHHTGQ